MSKNKPTWTQHLEDREHTHQAQRVLLSRLHRPTTQQVTQEEQNHPGQSFGNTKQRDYPDQYPLPNLGGCYGNQLDLPS
jgi:hypothetical protein